MLSAPGGATVEGRVMVAPPGWARGPCIGGANCSRSRPGCALGGITCATAVTGRNSNARTANRRPLPATIPAAPHQTPFHRDESRLARAGSDWNTPQALVSVSKIVEAL